VMGGGATRPGIYLRQGWRAGLPAATLRRPRPLTDYTSGGGVMKEVVARTVPAPCYPVRPSQLSALDLPSRRAKRWSPGRTVLARPRDIPPHPPADPVEREVRVLGCRPGARVQQPAAAGGGGLPKSTSRFSATVLTTWPCPRNQAFRPPRRG
jgi:hypothetical protein